MDIKQLKDILTIMNLIILKEIYLFLILTGREEYIDTCIYGKDTYYYYFDVNCDLKYEEISSITIDSLELYNCQYFYCSDINHCSFSYLTGRFEYIDEEGITRFYTKVLVGYNLETQEYLYSFDVVS